MRPTRIIFAGLAALFILAGNVFAFSTHNVTLERTFNKVQEHVNEQITVTATLINQESNSLRGFYFAEHIPQGLSVQTVSVKVDGNNVSNYVTETGLSGDVYAGCVPHRWILETPSAFSEDNPVASGRSVEIVYLLSTTQSGTFVLSEFNWVGYYQASSDPAFGYSEASDRQTLSFYLVTHALTINKSGTGQGTVFSSPQGINCGSICQYSFSDSTIVTLTAQIAQGATFVGWSGGGCSGNGTCAVTMDATKSVTATFERENRSNKGLPWLLLLLIDE